MLISTEYPPKLTNAPHRNTATNCRIVFSLDGLTLVDGLSDDNVMTIFFTLYLDILSPCLYAGGTHNRRDVIPASVRVVGQDQGAGG
jgi:hypothetical protein